MATTTTDDLAPLAASDRLREFVTPALRMSDIARDLGVNRETVRSWTVGRSRPSADLRDRLEQLTGIAASAWDDVPTLASEADGRVRARRGGDAA